MRLDNLGTPIFSSQDIFELIYQGKLDILPKLLTEPNDSEVIKFNENSEDIKLKEYQELPVTKEDFDQALQSDWFMPDEYKTMDIEGFLINLCPKENYQRLIDELQEYRARNMINLLRWLKYFVDTCRKNNIVWGVGRGSSVASYTLYLLGVHKIDSLKYNLDWREFLR
jgi:DNA polymerase III alpha subunit